MEENNEKKTSMTLNVIPIEEANENGKHLATILYKNDMAAYVMIVVGIILIITRNIWGILFGALFVGLSLFVLFKIEDHKCLEIYDDAILIYSNKNDNQVVRIPFTEIKQWSVNNRQQSSNNIIIVLNDDNCISKETYQINKAYDVLSDLIGDKEARAIELNKLKNQKVNLENPFKIHKKH